MPATPTSDAPLLEPLKSPKLKASSSPVTTKAAKSGAVVNLPTAAAAASAAPPAPPAEAAAAAKKSKSEFLNRVVFSLLMAYSFLALISQGAAICVPVVLLIMVMMFREILRIHQKERKDRHMPYFRWLPWWFLAVTIFVITTWNLRDVLVATYPWLRTPYHRFGLVAFLLYMTGLVAFVLSLKQGMYRYQFQQFTWIAMTLIFIVIQGSLQVTNMLHGMVWFLLPISCVVHNDIWAYAFGKSFGRTQLLLLSPKKTLEGFLGAWLFTMIWGFWFAGFLSRFPSLTCPLQSFRGPVSCERDPIFIPQEVPLPPWAVALTLHQWRTITVAPVQWHALVLAVFASLLAPFGGFFASGLKRAFKLKDFGDLIPGHGGMTDRMDCQIMMGMFTYVYVQSMVHVDQHCPSVETILNCVGEMAVEQQQVLLEKLQAMLVAGGGDGIVAAVAETAVNAVAAAVV